MSICFDYKRFAVLIVSVLTVSLCLFCTDSGGLDGLDGLKRLHQVKAGEEEL